MNIFLTKYSKPEYYIISAAKIKGDNTAASTNNTTINATANKEPITTSDDVNKTTKVVTIATAGNTANAAIAAVLDTDKQTGVQPHLVDSGQKARFRKGELS
jgi:hypothetical protein